MGASPAEAGSFVRFSVGRQTTAADADAAAAVFEAVINQVSRV
jgi:cysteine sulfinate desulfinase/cysteine desulfurase-like protein